MKRYIDADAVIKKVKRDIGLTRREKSVIMRAINYAPTADVVEVVRCKDCIHKEHCHETIAHTRIHDGFKEHWSEPIEWCSRGERKEE